MNISRADKVLLGGGTAVLGGSALFGVPLGFAVPAAALAAVMLDGIFRPTSSVFYPTIAHGPRDQPQVALTFDDGPDPAVTPAVLDILGAADARGTFFTIGRYLQRHAAIGQRIVDERHELGNHSWQHSRLQNFYGPRAHTEDLARNTSIIQKLTGSDREPLYRPPVGLKSPALARVATRRELTIVAWSLHSRDTVIRDPRAVAARVLRKIQPGDIVLLHDGHDIEGARRHVVLDALPLILDGLRQQGLQATTVSELLRR
ncbi:polysaccharide deacetylase family protein [Povalibacter sp.]|uniref:polysaccharide deacetylase family protein n=1 Tax=Povalibacter sp. TaxID=1962978 RepID=UPI002F4034BC